MRYDVLIVGGGIVGCAIARELTRYALTVALCEKEVEVGFGVTKANSGIIHGGHHATPSTLKGKLEWAGNQCWDALHAELGFGFKRIGELTVALSAEQLPVLTKLLEHGQVQGIPGMELWDSGRVAHEEPALTTAIAAALFAPTTGVVNPYEACFALAECAVNNGLALWLGCPVHSLTQVDGGWRIATSRGDLFARFVINAAGLFSDQVAAMAGVPTFAIHPRKGEEFLLDKRLRGLVKHVIFPCPTPTSKGILIIPTVDGTLMIGPTAHDEDDREAAATSAEGAAEVFAAVTRLAPGISARDVIAQFAGLRAVADGEDFVIGPTANRGFINVAGVQSPGLTAAPAIAAMVTEILRTEGLPLAARDDFAPTLPRPLHFMSLPLADQIELAQRDVRYRRLVCRCEFVTEGEVLDAIGRGAVTLDGVKFRTRAGMGRCQGGFCTSRCLELLAHSQGIPITAVTKRGGASWLVCSRDETGQEPV